MINYKHNIPVGIEKVCHRLVRITVVSCQFIGYILRYFPIFIDIDKGILFNFKKTLKLLGHPGLICKAKTYYYFLLILLDKVAKNCYF